MLKKQLCLAKRGTGRRRRVCTAHSNVHLCNATVNLTLTVTAVLSFSTLAPSLILHELPPHSGLLPERRLQLAQHILALRYILLQRLLASHRRCINAFIAPWKHWSLNYRPSCKMFNDNFFFFFFKVGCPQITVLPRST